MLEIQLSNSMKEAMKSKDLNKLSALRSIRATFLNLNTSGKEINEDSRLKALQTMVKQRQESSTIFKDNNRPDLYEKEIFEISVIETFLPKKLSDAEVEEEIKKYISSSISATPPFNIKQIGVIIGIINRLLVGKADGKTISDITKRLLS